MSKELYKVVYTPCIEPWRDGFIIPVRNRLNNMLQNEFLPVEYKEKYTEDWGDALIYDDVFTDWYCDLKKKELGT